MITLRAIVGVFKPIGEVKGKEREQRAGGEIQGVVLGDGRGRRGGKLEGRDARLVSWSRFDRLRLGWSTSRNPLV